MENGEWQFQGNVQRDVGKPANEARKSGDHYCLRPLRVSIWETPTFLVM